MQNKIDELIDAVEQTARNLSKIQMGTKDWFKAYDELEKAKSELRQYFYEQINKV